MSRIEEALKDSQVKRDQRAGKAKKAKPQKEHPWRDNIEAITMAIVMAVFLKYFIVEAYKIPTGSMQPTLMGNADTGIFDRILVDKLSYHFREPERWEVAVFKYPLDRSKNFIKRIWGMPEEELKIENGDVFRRPDEGSPWAILRRPDPVQEECWRALTHAGNWRFDRRSEGWKESDSGIAGAGPGSARFPRARHSITDSYYDGYPPGMVKNIKRPPRVSDRNEVGDVRIRARIQAEPACTSVNLDIQEGLRRYRLAIPGPAAVEGELLRVEVTDAAGQVEDRIVPANSALRLAAGRDMRVMFQNLDDQLTVEIGGEQLLEVEIAAIERASSSISLVTDGAGASFEELRIDRDIYYTSQNAKKAHWKIPEDSYVVLGDNTQDSADSREWTLSGYEVHSGEFAGTTLRGNKRQRENPMIVRGSEGGPEIYFHDEWGERRHFKSTEALQRTFPEEPFVTRELITGRALVVFWPFSPRMGVYRLKWVR